MFPQSGDRREHERRLVPYLAMRIHDRAFEVRDWSLSGFTLFEVDEAIAALGVGSEVAGHFGLSINREMPFSFSARIIDLNPGARRYAFAFSRMPLASFEALRAFAFPGIAAVSLSPASELI